MVGFGDGNVTARGSRTTCSRHIIAPHTIALDIRITRCSILGHCVSASTNLYPAISHADWHNIPRLTSRTMLNMKHIATNMLALLWLYLSVSQNPLRAKGISQIPSSNKRHLSNLLVEQKASLKSPRPAKAICQIHEWVPTGSIFLCHSALLWRPTVMTLKPTFCILAMSSTPRPSKTRYGLCM